MKLRPARHAGAFYGDVPTGDLASCRHPTRGWVVPADRIKAVSAAEYDRIKAVSAAEYDRIKRYIQTPARAVGAASVSVVHRVLALEGLDDGVVTRRDVYVLQNEAMAFAPRAASPATYDDHVVHVPAVRGRK